jgi:hypothetical protein
MILFVCSDRIGFFVRGCYFTSLFINSYVM